MGIVCKYREKWDLKKKSYFPPSWIVRNSKTFRSWLKHEELLNSNCLICDWNQKYDLHWNFWRSINCQVFRQSKSQHFELNSLNLLKKAVRKKKIGNNFLASLPLESAEMASSYRTFKSTNINWVLLEIWFIMLAVK